MREASASSAGRPLAPASRARFERAYGADLSDVRLHDDGASRVRARGIQAKAFTLGNDIHLDGSEVQLGSTDGDSVLAHELAHVLQFRLASSPGSATPGSVSHPLDTVERNAEQASESALAGRPFTLVQASASTLYRAVTTKCVAPSEIVDQVTSGTVGGVVEKIIELDYCSKMGCRPFATDFFDVAGAVPYIAFLAAHNPSLDVELVAVQVGLSGGVLIPDILADLPARKDWYEIKPNSIDGRAAGRIKLAAIPAFMSFNSLPYVPGTTYVPTPTIPLPLVGPTVAAVLNLPAAAACGPPDVALEATLLMPGLIVYRVCITADFECYAKVIALEALAAAVIAAIIATAGAGAPAAAPVLAPVLAL